MNFLQNGKASLEQIPTAEENSFIFYLVLFTPSEAYMPLLISAGTLPGPASVSRSLRPSDTYAIKRCESQRQASRM